MACSLHMAKCEEELCRKAFSSFDKDGSGTIDVRELKAVLASMNQHPTDEELFVMIHAADEDNSGEIDYSEFQRVVTKHKAATASKGGSEADTVDAFVALGGNPDTSGTISADKLRATIQAFELTLDIERLLREIDPERSGLLSYKDFKLIVGAA